MTRPASGGSPCPKPNETTRNCGWSAWSWVLVVVSSMNRGGLAGSVFEMDDRMTGYDVRGTIDAGFEAAKMLARVDVGDPATVATLETCGRAVTELNRAGVVAILEPILTRRVEGRAVNDLSPYESWRAALAQPGVRGLIVGRSLLYPPDDDVAAAVDTAVSLVRPERRVRS
ncbi:MULTISPECIES: hypothetical protein [unclassified Amycolatopsis]|uniref:Cgl0159 family (beta/alpha)8-fold protein n=1 Tax=unclassified Amycolatopsis TaxID=2618356 RepID=UPI001C6A4EB9|nr:hypothetical protein [Amycolatopsis sp. DSM 110486]QYN19229.1 hypothetical protein K1T34_42420 [Amycolatopsis sp. DSM 110486]